MKKLLALILSLIMIFSFSATALAADEINILTVTTSQNGNISSSYGDTRINYKNNTITITGSIPTNITNVGRN